jgi:hypothetical protein
MFVTVNGFPDYKINEDGVIYNAKKKTYLNPKRPTVGLYRDGKSSDGYKRDHMPISKLVYEHFSEDKDNIVHLSKFDIKHIDGNECNNNIDNLQLVTRKQNLQKRKKKANCSSNYIGVSWKNKLNRWSSKIEIDKKTYTLGNYQHAENAAYVYDQVSKHFRDPDFYYNETVKDLTLPEEHENKDEQVNKMIHKINKFRSQARIKKQDCSSKYIGVHWKTDIQKWFTRISIHNKSYCLGSFKHEENAAYVYDAIAIKFKPELYKNKPALDITLPEEHEDRDDQINKMINKIN